ncbi:MAG: hypothetical protein ACRDD3_02340 [Azovibrio sp.]
MTVKAYGSHLSNQLFELLEIARCAPGTHELVIDSTSLADGK